MSTTHDGVARSRSYPISVCALSMLRLRHKILINEHDTVGDIELLLQQSLRFPFSHNNITP